MNFINHGPFRRKGVDEYVKRMSKPREKAIYDSTVTHMLTSAGYEIPEDPASIYNPDQLWDQLDRYCVKQEYVEDEFIDRAIKRAFRAFGYRESYSRKLIPLQSETEIYNAVKLEKHAGVYFSTKLDAWNRAWTRQEDVVYKRKRPNPCLAGVRTQRGNKTRLVWMYPLEMTMLEAKFARPLIEVYKEIRSPMPYALRRHEIGARLEYSLKGRNKVALDFSKFDSSVPSKLIRTAFRIMATWFRDFEDFDKESWKVIQNYFINTPIVMIDGNLYTGKRHGVPSGSYFTQLVDSIVNYIIITASMLKYDMHPHERRVHVLGDDSVFATDVNVNLSELKSYFLTKGFKLNVEKSAVVRSNEPIHFIGFDWLHGVPSRETEKALLSLTQPENWRKREDEFKHEQQRAFRLILEMCTLGVNLYEVLRNVVPARPREHLFLAPEDKGLTNYMNVVLQEHGKPYWRNAATGIWI